MKSKPTMPGSGRSSARSRIRSSADNDDDDSLRRTKPNLKLRKFREGDRSSIRIFNVDLSVMLGICLLGFFIIFFLIRHLVNPVEESQLLRVVKPFPAPKVMDLPQFQGDHKESLYWGTYRPHVYLGIRARTPQSLIAGLMWIGVKEGRYYMRHVCQNNDELITFGWTHHNGRDFGHQVLVDHDMTLTTSFLKSKEDGSGYGGDWAIRIDVQNEKSKGNGEFGRGAHLFFYLADEGGNTLSVSGDGLDIHGGSFLASGSRKDIGSWQLHLKSTNDLEVHYCGFKSPHFHNLSDLVQENLGAQVRKFGRLQLPDSSDDSPNILVFQISATVPFKTDFLLISGTDLENSRVEERVGSLTGTSLTSRLKGKEREFDNKFERSFNLAGKLDSESIFVGKAAIGNLLGGIGYFYGQSKIALPRNFNLKSHDNYVSYWPAELYTAVPSRSFFPRGFLWDEGFHQLLIWRWDIHICLDILGHWLDLMNVDGWIPREQILGAEALSKVPEEFVPQHSTNGNPPTLFLVLRDIVHGIKNKKFTATESNEILLFLERASVRLEAWFQWFNTSQSGNQMSSYYWHGRDNMTARELNPKTLSSGLDDYPRASHPSGDERHLDIRCWMFLAADCMHSISELLGKATNPAMNYGATAKLLSDFEILNQMHFDDAYGAYFDFGNHTEKVRLSWKEMKVGNNYAARELLREVLERPELKLVPHIGYVSLFPFMTKIIPPESWILEKQLDIISNRSILWTDYGLRSLAKTSTLYMKRNTEHDPPYWRGPIWININYMILSALHHYSKVDGPYKDRARAIYEDLRGNLIRNLVHNYYQTGFLWEQYDQRKGKGKGARLFTGWTSLLVLIMAEAYGES
ncbi:mannosyl-oligosaccharide glucosidase GCS1-like [Quillaja saponaria]|uniref:Mannosyl-oligosaccharide glucosidase n=1 Tax=Quillaja saponaria TaxID=32244 RepID=A0AAD7LHQ2_QUISA|nr:mannosyl-oligosaccharide glucosidase GCS1-like [Quillaja saponaria]